jgi:TatD DNase family protein
LNFAYFFVFYERGGTIMFDFHIHIARLPQKKQLTQLLYDSNYDFIAIACEPWEWEEVAQLKKFFSTEIKPFKLTYGIHPMIATQANDEMFAKLREYLQDEHAMVGEAGIDKRYPGYEDGTQDRVFLEQAKLALELKRDLQIHCVGDYMRILKLLSEAGFPQDRAQGRDAQDLQVLPRMQESPRPIFHRFGGDLSVVQKALPYGALFSLHADSFRKKSTAAAIPHIPQERVFFETDADESFLDPGELAEALANRLESVRAAYAECCQ